MALLIVLGPYNLNSTYLKPQWATEIIYEVVSYNIFVFKKIFMNWNFCEEKCPEQDSVNMIKPKEGKFLNLCVCESY